MQNKPTPTIYITGPTGSGKSGLAVELAVLYGAEIVCADSQTIRKGLDILSAKPNMAERSLVNHHLLDVIEIDDKYSLNMFLSQSNSIIDNLKENNTTVIVVGGTGLYLDALYYKYSLRNLDHNKANDHLESLSVIELQDALANSNIALPDNQNNKRHLINTLRAGGALSKQGDHNIDDIYIAVYPGPQILKRSLMLRIDKMIEHGLVKEVTNARNLGKKIEHLGFETVCNYVDKHLPMLEMKLELLNLHLKYANTQLTWMRRNKRIRWFDDTNDAKEFIMNTYAKDS
jgi:tRNA dimethylallyltransferase